MPVGGEGSSRYQCSICGVLTSSESARTCCRCLLASDCVLPAGAEGSSPWQCSMCGVCTSSASAWKCRRCRLDSYCVLPVGGEGSSPYQCSMCGVCTSSEALLEAHFKGRRHLKRALEQAHADAADLGLQPTPTPASAIPR